MMFISQHKMVGGFSSPGVLVRRRAPLLLQQPAHAAVVRSIFEEDHDHLYVNEMEEREEGDTKPVTQDIAGVDAVSCALAFPVRLKAAVGPAKNLALHWSLRC
jgi:selenocysteine lyase/cysteine desulfurase